MILVFTYIVLIFQFKWLFGWWNIDFSLGAYLFHVSSEVGLSLCPYIPKSNCSLDGEIHSMATHTTQKPIPTKLNLFICPKHIHGSLNVGPLWYKCILGGGYFSLLLDKCTLGQEYFDSEKSRCIYNVVCFLKPLILYSNFRTRSFPIQLQQAHGKVTPHEWCTYTRTFEAPHISSPLTASWDSQKEFFLGR